MKLCVALDLSTLEQNLHLAKQLKSFDVWLKVGFRSYIRDGKDFLTKLKNINPNFKIFLDLKLYDIPNTMANTAQEIASLDIDMFNVHASSGIVAMKTVMDSLSSFKTPPLVLAVTALTSFDNDSFRNIYNENIDTKAIQFAKDAYSAKMDGVVSSVFESFNIKQHTSQDFITLTPGIRPFNEDSADQKRVANIQSAKKELVDFIVVGRPIYQSNNPKDTVEKIIKNIQK
jgi:orotidine-5'-phosphate decarboxylase